MGNKNDGHDKHTSTLPEHIKTYGEDGLAQHGNDDAKKLSNAYKQLSKNGLTEAETEKLKKLDQELKGAEFHCLSSDVTLVTQHENNTETNFVVLGNDLKQNTGFENSKPKKTR